MDTPTSTADGDAIAYIRHWTFKPVVLPVPRPYHSWRTSYTSPTALHSFSVASDSKPSSNNQQNAWTNHDQAKWLRMCQVLKELASSTTFPLLKSSEPSVLSDDETFWIERFQTNYDNMSSNDSSSSLCIDDKNGFYKLKVPLVMNPTVAGTICLVSQGFPANSFCTGEPPIQTWIDSSTQFLHFLNQFSVIAGRLFPRVFVVSCRYIPNTTHYWWCGLCDSEQREKILDENTGNIVPVPNGGNPTELYPKIQSFKDVTSLSDLCTAKLMVLALGGGGAKTNRTRPKDDLQVGTSTARSSKASNNLLSKSVTHRPQHIPGVALRDGFFQRGSGRSRGAASSGGDGDLSGDKRKR